VTLTSIGRRAALTASLALAFGVRIVAAQAAADPNPARFEAEIKAFGELDRKSTPPKGAVLFVGSSSIRLWPTAERFPNLTVINRGFGGSHISDVNHYFDQTVRKYAANVVVLYAGDNDLGSGKSSDRVFADYQAFVEKVHAAKPDTEIVFVAIKPSLARWKLWDTMKAFNERVRAFSSSRARLHFVDVAPPMLGANGQPRPELFVEDGLHMTPAGYDIWTGLVSRALTSLNRK
jgi:lysophospholipase L1-like esterase